MLPARPLLLMALLLPCGFYAHSAETHKDLALTGVWFGDFVLTNPDGKISHDTAVLVVQQTSPILKGSMGRTIDQQTPWTNGAFEHHHIHFHLDAAGGLDVTLDLHTGSLTGVAAGNDIHASIALKPAPGLLPHQQLVQEITTADRELYDAFSNCDVNRYASFLSKDLEFYQDHTGKTGYEENLQALRNRCAEGIRLRRELQADSLIVNAAPGFGAIQAGIHRFYSQGQDGQEHLDATARFTNVWSKATGSWQLVRVISYDHQ